MEITEGRDYTRGTKTKEEKEAKEENGEHDQENEENEEGDEAKGNRIELGALLKYVAQGWEPTKPPPSNPLRPIR